MEPSALLITGTVGSGKTSVSEAIGDQLTDAGIPNAVIDLDWLRRAWPCPAADRFNLALTLRNLAPVSRNFIDAGAVRLVLAGVVETREERARYEEALGIPLVVCRLVVDLPTVRARLIGRHVDDDAGLAWHLDRSGELDAILERAAVEDLVVNASRLSISLVASAALRAVGWDDPLQST